MPVVLPRPAIGGADPNQLKLLISIQQQTIKAPFPARLTLHLHNAGQEPVWLYRRACNPQLPTRPLAEENKPAETVGGSTLVGRLEPLGPAASQAIATPARVKVIESVGLPRPKLVELAPGGDYEEKTTLGIAPALSGTNAEQKPVWGRYRLSVIYRASYSNAEEIRRNLGVRIWEGEVESNMIEVELLPPVAEAAGSITGSVITSDSRPVMNARVSLSDQQERVVEQALVDQEGRFSFTHLPWGLYWLTARRENASEDTAVFRHAELTPAEPSGNLQLVMLVPEIYEPQKLLHKPVLFRVTDNSGKPLSKVGLEATWSNGAVVDNVKGETGDDGAVALELLPGRNFVTLKRHGCPKQEDRADVAPGDGIDGFKLVFDCARR